MTFAERDADMVLGTLNMLAFLNGLWLYQANLARDQAVSLVSDLSARELDGLFVRGFVSAEINSARFDWLRSQLSAGRAEVLYEPEQRVPKHQWTFGSHEVDYRRDLVMRHRDSLTELAHGVITAAVSPTALGYGELRQVFVNVARTGTTARRRPRIGLSGSGVYVDELQQASPVSLTLAFWGGVAALYALTILGQWTRNYVEHSKMDVKLKEQALEASELALEQLREHGVHVTPDVLKALIENGKITPTDLTNGTNIKIDIL
ncbi:MAG: hypothetical protein GKS06_11210 [Acidobacteria bacterium]|nr:hypothetical protein [Acidobacteriota bacterium]